MIKDPDNKSQFNQQLTDIVAKSKQIAVKATAGTGRFLSNLGYSIKSAYNGHKQKSSQKLRRTGRERIYKLKGYTTVAKINRKRQAERQQRFLRKFLFVFIAVLLLILLFTLYNPFKDLSEVKKILGIDSVDDLTKARYTIETTSEETSETDYIINTNLTLESSDDESIQD